jgi:DNA-binding LacI/PurR family transcriptional regulator
MSDSRLTINDIAKKAGVSRQTISRVLNNTGPVKEGTRKLIERIIQEVGFEPSIQASSMVTKKTNAVALLIPDITNPFFSQIVQGVERTLRKQNMNVLLFATDETIDREISCIQFAHKYNVDGLILCSPRLDEVNLRKLVPKVSPTVILNRNMDMNGVACVMVDAVQGSRDATKYLLENGHRRIGILVGPSKVLSSHLRLSGYKSAISEFGLELEEQLIFHIDHYEMGINEATRQMIKQKVTAIMTYNDVAAASVIQICSELGKKVPEDISVLGFDGSPIAGLMNPRLTTMEIPLLEIGETLALTLMKMISGQQPYNEFVEVLPLLKVGGTTGPLKKKLVIDNK